MSLLERIYFFHREILEENYPNSGDIMAEFEVSAATAHRDIAYLRDRLLAPLLFDQHKNGYFYENSSFSLPFEESPKLLLFLGLLGAMAHETGLEELPEIVELKKRLAKISAVEGVALDALIHCEWTETEPVEHDIFSSILAGLISKRQLLITYHNSSGDKSTRKIEPLQLVNYQGRWYLLGYCHLRTDRRLFHVSRMSGCEIQQEVCKHHFDRNDDYLRGVFGIFKGAAKDTACIRFTGKAMEIVGRQRWHPDQKIHREKDHLTMTLPVADDREIIMKVLQFGHEAAIISPKAMRKKVILEIEKMSLLYN